jgi:hypothetical protein
VPPLPCTAVCVLLLSDIILLLVWRTLVVGVLPLFVAASVALVVKPTVMGASGVLSALWAARPVSSIGHPATSQANVPVFSAFQSTDPPLGGRDTGGVGGVNVSGDSAIVVVDSCGICQRTSAVLVVGRLVVVWLSDRDTEDGKK